MDPTSWRDVDDVGSQDSSEEELDDLSSSWVEVETPTFGAASPDNITSPLNRADEHSDGEKESIEDEDKEKEKEKEETKEEGVKIDDDEEDENATNRQSVQETVDECMLFITEHLLQYLEAPSTDDLELAPASYEGWISSLHPENCGPSIGLEPGAVDVRFYAASSKHRQLWNKHCHRHWSPSAKPVEPRSLIRPHNNAFAPAMDLLDAAAAAAEAAAAEAKVVPRMTKEQGGGGAAKSTEKSTKLRPIARPLAPPSSRLWDGSVRTSPVSKLVGHASGDGGGGGGGSGGGAPRSEPTDTSAPAAALLHVQPWHAHMFSSVALPSFLKFTTLAFLALAVALSMRDHLLPPSTNHGHNSIITSSNAPPGGGALRRLWGGSRHEDAAKQFKDKNIFSTVTSAKTTAAKLKSDTRTSVESKRQAEAEAEAKAKAKAKSQQARLKAQEEPKEKRNMPVEARVKTKTRADVDEAEAERVRAQRIAEQTAKKEAAEKAAAAAAVRHSEEWRRGHGRKNDGVATDNDSTDTQSKDTDSASLALVGYMPDFGSITGRLVISAALGIAGFGVGVPYVPGLLDNVIVGAVAAAVPFANETVVEGWQAVVAKAIEMPGVGAASTAAMQGWSTVKERFGDVPSTAQEISGNIYSKSAHIYDHFKGAIGAISGEQFGWIRHNEGYDEAVTTHHSPREAN